MFLGSSISVKVCPNVGLWQIMVNKKSTNKLDTNHNSLINIKMLHSELTMISCL